MGTKIIKFDQAASDAILSGVNTMADAVKASEQISTVKRLSEAERRKELALMEAVQKAEIAGTHMRIQAKAEQETAGAKAAAALELAKGDAAAQNVRTEAMKSEMIAEADGKRALNEAENTISDRLVVMRMNRNRLEALQIVPMPPPDDGRVHFGCWVEIEDDEGETQIWRIVGPDETERGPLCISSNSPMARALLGHELDDEIVVKRPVGDLEAVIVGIFVTDPDL